jgi:hypothetical protein
VRRHGRPPRGSSWLASASTAPAPGVAAVARPVEVVRRERRAVPRRVLVGILLGAAASWSSSCTLCARAERQFTVARRNSKQHANRQARNGDYLRVRGFGPSHPRRHRQRRAIGAPHDIVDLVVKVVQPDHWEVLCTQRMVAVIDRNFSRALLMGSMSFSCVQSSQAKSDREDLRRHQRERPPHPDLDSLDCLAPVEMAAPPLQGQLVSVQSGINAAAEPVYLPRFAEVARQPVRDTATTARIPTTYSGAGITWTGTTGGNGRPRSDDPDSQLPKLSLSTADIRTLPCFGQQWYWSRNWICMNLQWFPIRARATLFQRDESESRWNDSTRTPGHPRPPKLVRVEPNLAINQFEFPAPQPVALPAT